MVHLQTIACQNFYTILTSVIIYLGKTILSTSDYGREKYNKGHKVGGFHFIKTQKNVIGSY